MTQFYLINGRSRSRLWQNVVSVVRGLCCWQLFDIVTNWIIPDYNISLSRARCILFTLAQSQHQALHYSSWTDLYDNLH